MGWRIKTFDDYSIIPESSLIYKSIELGCYPVKRKRNWKYFGLFYTGKKPTLKQVLKSVKRKIDFNRWCESISDGDREDGGFALERDLKSFRGVTPYAPAKMEKVCA